MFLTDPPFSLQKWKMESTMKTEKTFRKNENKNVKNKIKSCGNKEKHFENENKPNLRDTNGPPYLPPTFHLPHTTIGFFRANNVNPQMVFSEPPTFGGMQHTFSQMKKLYILQGSVVGKGVGITVCFVLR